MFLLFIKGKVGESQYQYIDNIMNNKRTRIGYNKTYHKLLMREESFFLFLFILLSERTL